MPESQLGTTPNVRDALLSASMLCSERIRVGKLNETKHKQLTEELGRVESDLKSLTECFNWVTRIYKNIEEHERLRHEDSLRIFNEAIQEIAHIIPDANMRGMHLSISESNRVRIINGKGQDINLREGGGARTSLGILLRYSTIIENEGAIPMMLLDESFFTLSDNTTLEMRRLLEDLSKRCLIIGIEQRRNVLGGLSEVEYEFIKDEFGKTHVRRNDLG